jgi:hypothetical protein
VASRLGDFMFKHYNTKAQKHEGTKLQRKAQALVVSRLGGFVLKPPPQHKGTKARRHEGKRKFCGFAPRWLYVETIAKHKVTKAQRHEENQVFGDFAP